ncbi:MAG: 50S ribosomal protein L29 [Clostridia bacterium]
MNIQDIKAMSASELSKTLKDQKQELFNLRFQHSINQLDNPMKIVETKKTIARIMTVLHQKESDTNAKA